MVVLGALIQFPKVSGHKESTLSRQSTGQSGQDLESGSTVHVPWSSSSVLFRGSLKSGGRVQEEEGAQSKLGVSIEAKKATSLLVIKGEKERKPCWTFRVFREQPLRWQQGSGQSSMGSKDTCPLQGLPAFGKL